MYTKADLQTMLANAEVLVTADGTYRIDAVVEDEIYITDEATGDQHIITYDEIDLNDPEVLLYRYTLMNPVKV